MIALFWVAVIGWLLSGMRRAVLGLYKLRLVSHGGLLSQKRTSCSLSAQTVFRTSGFPFINPVAVTPLSVIHRT
jgi:hypothetical protein